MNIENLSENHPYRVGFRAGLRSFNKALPVAKNPYNVTNDGENYEFWRKGFNRGCTR